MRSLALLALLAVVPGLAASQQLSSPSREKYKDVRTEPLVKHDIAAYSGVYQVDDLGDVIDLRIDHDGRIQADGHDSDRPGRKFVLQDAKIAGAVLTATKV